MWITPAAVPAAMLVLGALAIADARSSGPDERTLARGGPKVRVATTGNKSELRKTVPITRRSGREKRVVMSMGPAKLPSLSGGDRLKLSAELYVTNDCDRPQRRCVGRPYHYDPRVRAKLILARRQRVTGGRRALGLASKRITCRQRLPNRQHHCVVVFKRAGVDVTPAALPCALERCHANLVVSAHSRQATGHEKLIVGANLPDGSIVQDRGRVNAVRYSPGSQDRPRPRRVHRPRRDQLSFDRKPEVVLSERLSGLERGEQLDVSGTVRTGIAHLSYNSRVTSQLILARRPGAVRHSRIVDHVASLRGEITEQNGFNCTQAQTPCRSPKVGVLTMERNARNRRGDRVPLYVNFVLDVKAKRADPRPGEAVRVLGGGLRVVRFPAGRRG